MNSNEYRLLQLKSVSSGYGRVQILRAITIDVREGEVLAIIGRNGVGKTTLMRTIIGALPNRGGDISFESRSMAGLSAHARARLGIGYVPQGRGIFSKLTVRENLLMGERIGERPITESHYDRVHAFFPILKERANQMAGSMSGGQQQQLALGRALLGMPRLLLLDEPSEGIQPNIIQDMGALVKQLSRSERLAVIVVEQNLDLIRLMADRCAVMDKGELVAEIEPETLGDPAVAAKYLAI